MGGVFICLGKSSPLKLASGVELDPGSITRYQREESYIEGKGMGLSLYGLDNPHFLS